MTPTILVVEDEPAILELLRVNLGRRRLRSARRRRRGRARTRRSEGGAARSACCSTGCCPGSRGSRFAKQLRAEARTKELPVIMVTARTDEADRVAGLEAWVDDYVTKPFSPRELKARIKSVLRRRAPEAAQEPLAAGDCELDPATHRVTADDAPVRARADGIPAAPIPDGAARARAHARAASRSGVGRPRLHRGAHRRRPHPPLAPRARAVRASTADRNRARQRLSARVPRRADVAARTARAPAESVILQARPCRRRAVGPRGGARSAGRGSGAAARWPRASAGARSRASTLVHLARLRDWASGPLDASGAGRPRAVALRPSRRSTAAPAPARAHERELAHHDRALRERARRRFPMAWSCSTRPIASSGLTRARSASSASTCSRTSGAPIDEPRAAAGVRPLSRVRRACSDAIVIDSQREAGDDARDPDRALRRRQRSS